MRKYFLIVFILTSASISSQAPVDGDMEFPELPCAYDDAIQRISERNPLFRNAVDITFQKALRLAEIRSTREIYTIPVVFHVVYHEDIQNLADEIIYSQLDRMNEDYRRMNENAVETRQEFLPFAGDAMIEFVPAAEDPDGNPTTGITHTYTERNGFPYIDIWDMLTGEITLDDVKQSSEGGVDAWDTNRYLNIWVCNIEESFLGQVLGFAYPPIDMDVVLDNLDADSQPDWTMMEGQIPDESLQGVVVHYSTVGPGNPAAGDDGFSENDLGRTIIHEIGHYLGLRHIWGDALFTGGCSVDDGITDTPNQNAASSFNCIHTINSCSDSPVDFPDMVENYMDYSSDACMNMFSLNQIAVMRAVLEFARPELIVGQTDECLTGDINGDEDLNVLDVVTMVGLALDQQYYFCADMNMDNAINVLDIVQLVNLILDN